MPQMHRIDRETVKKFLFFAALQFASYLNLTVNFRAIAHEQYAFAGGSAAMAAILAWVMVRNVVKDESRYGLLGLVIGGAVADMSGIWLTRMW